MLEILREFFGLGEKGYTRPADGAYSAPHLIIVAIFVTAMVGLGLWLGLRNRKRDDKTKTKVLIVAAILIDSLELIKIVINCINSGWGAILTNLPLFLCSIQLIVLPVAAFSKGRIKEAAIDFVLIFGLLGGVLGIVGAAQNYNAYPAVSFTNLVSAATHSISGFASIYIAASGMFTLKKKNYLITNGILLVFVVLALIANELIPYNYMFLKSHDGTPYSIFYNMVGGNPIFYPIIVVGVFVIWIFGFYGVKWLVDASKKPAAQNSQK
ncbi:MAG: YwaF family protein [Clostridia bacterium]|nr:YwaF family protein [Clostridia bacterium]